jgi:hypothetical protein
MKGKVAIEVKALLTQTQDRLYQKGNAMGRKDNYVAANGTKRTYTVAVDYIEPDSTGKFAPTNSRPDVYIRQGYGSFRLVNMTQVAGGLKGLKDYI